MARKTTRTRRRFVRPRLMPTDAPLAAEAAGQTAEALWRRGERAEEEFDYEAARGWYREATRCAPAESAAELAGRYATFLVERYGQYHEVAAWLDDEAFDPLAGAESGATSLAQLVALAAHEVDHVRSADLDLVLARELGEPQALTRVAMGMATGGQTEEALSLLLEHRSSLPPLSEASKLLEQLLGDQEAACTQALAEVTAALERRDAVGAEHGLARVDRAWAEHALFRAAQARTLALRTELEAEALRREIEAALDASAFERALTSAQALVQLMPDSEGDRSTLVWIEERLREQARQRRLEQLKSTQAPLEQMRLLVELLQGFGADRDPPPDHATAWALAREAASQSLLSQGAEPYLWTCVRLSQMTAAGELDQVEPLLATLPELWQRMSVVRAATSARNAALRARAQAEDAAIRAEVQALIDAGDLAAARAAAERHGQTTAGRSPTVRALLKTLDGLAQEASRREGLLSEARDRLAAGELFTAGRRIAALAEQGVAAEDIDALRRDLEAAREGALRARPVPPFALKVDQSPIATGVADGRLVIVQGRLWLSVNLETRGLQPFMLPEAWPLAERPGARMAQVDDRLVLIGFSRGRLVRIEQLPGAAPEVVEARPLKELVRGDDRILGTAIEPDAETYMLLSQSSARAGSAATLTRIDARTLDTRDSSRHKPALIGAVGVRHQPGAVLVATSAESRARKAWAAGLLDTSQRAGAAPTLELTQDDLVEPVAFFSRAIAWPEQRRLYASYSVFDVFDAEEVRATPSLLVLKDDRIVFASTDLRRRFAPVEKLIIDHPWTLDTRSGRLWFAALPRQDAEQQDALLLGVDAQRLRADQPVALQGVARVLAIEPVVDGAVALCRLHEGRLAVTRARVDERGEIALTIDALPV